MKNLVRLCLPLFLLVSFGFIFQTSVFAQKTIYLKVDSENLRLSPKGTIIGQLKKGAELVEMERKGKWVKVVFSGWIWAPSTTAKKDEALGPKNRASIIMLEYETDANEVLTQLRAGKSFEELAKLKSIHPTAQKGGDLGFFRKGDFDAKFENAIFGLSPNQTSEILKLEFNGKTYYCLFKRIQ